MAKTSSDARLLVLVVEKVHLLMVECEEVEKIMRKLPSDACKPYLYGNFLNLLKQHVTWKVLIHAETLSYPALLLLQNPYLAPNLTGSFISKFSELFTSQIEILTCPWGPLLRGGGKGDEFTDTFKMALDLVLADPNAIIHSMQYLSVKRCLIGWAYGR